MSLDQYRKEVKILADNRSSIVFPNEGAEHAAVVLGNIFEKSNMVRIYANDMSGEIGNREDYYNSLKVFLEREEVTLKVIIDSPESLKQSTSKSLLLIKKKMSENPTLDIEFIPSNDDFKERVKGAIKTFGKVPYFTVGDADKFRVEYDNETHKATCSFNDIKTSSKLIDLFDEYFNLGKDKKITLA